MKKTLLAVTVAVLGLSACSNLNNKTPQEMVNISVERSLTKDYSYNFEGHARFFLSDKDKGLAPKVAAAAEQKYQNQHNKQVIEAKTGDDFSDLEVSDVKIEGGLGKKAADFAQKHPVLTQYIQNMQFNMKGAVDLRTEKMEFISEIVNDNKNEYSKIQLPVLFDGKNMTVTVDLPATIPMFLDLLLENKELSKKLAGNGIQFAWKDMDKKEIPLRSTVKAFIKSSHTAYKAIPPNAYKLVDVDEFGKQAGAKYRIDIIWNSENLNIFNNAFYRDFDSELTRMQQEDFEEGATEEGYQKVRKFVAMALGQRVEKDADESNNFELFEKMFGSPMIESLYLDRKGRMVARRSYLQTNGEEKAVNIEMSMQFNRFGKPVFTFNPDQEKVVTFSELVKIFKSRIDVEEEQADDIVSPDKPNVIKEEIIK